MASLNIENAKKFSDLSVITSAPDSALILLNDGNGVKTITVANLKADLKSLISAYREGVLQERDE